MYSRGEKVLIALFFVAAVMMFVGAIGNLVTGGS